MASIWITPSWVQRNLRSQQVPRGCTQESMAAIVNAGPGQTLQPSLPVRDTWRSVHEMSFSFGCCISRCTASGSVSIRCSNAFFRCFKFVVRHQVLMCFRIFDCFYVESMLCDELPSSLAHFYKKREKWARNRTTKMQNSVSAMSSHHIMMATVMKAALTSGAYCCKIPVLFQSMASI